MIRRLALVRVLASLADQVLSIGAVFLANVVLARESSASEYGAFALMYTLVTFLSGVHNGLLLEAFTVHGSGRYKSDFEAYWRTALRGNITIVVSLSVAVVVGASAYAGVAGFDRAAGYFVLAAVLPVLLTSLFLRRVLYVEGRSVKAGAMAAVFFVSVVLLLLMARSSVMLGGSWVLVIFAVSWMVASPVFFVGRRGILEESTFARRNPGYLSHHWQYSKWVVLTALVFQFTAQGYFWLAAMILDTASVAELRAAWNLVQVPVVIFSSLSFVMLPRLANVYQHAGEKMSGMAAEISRYSLVVLMVGLGCAALFWQFGGMAYSLLYAGKYDKSLELLYVVALMPVTAGLGGVFADALRAVERPGLVFYAYIVGGIWTLAVGVPSIIYHGLVGAAWGMVASNIGYAGTLVVCFWWIGRRHKLAAR